MKSSCAFFLIFLSLIPFSFSTSRLHDSPAQPVFSSSGEELRAGRLYYFLPTPGPPSPFGGGLVLTSNANNKICPFNIAQAWNALLLGLPFSFDAFRSGGDPVIRENTRLYVVVPERPIDSCPEQTVWTIVNSGEDNVVATGAPQAFVTTSLWYFRIQRVIGTVPYSYKLSYCVECLNCFPGPVETCRDVSVKEIGGERLLVLDNEHPLILNFVDAVPRNSII